MNWIRAWTTEYALLSVALFGEEYTGSFFDEIGIGFSKLVFESKKGLATAYRLESEQHDFSTKAARKIVLQDGFMEHLEDRMTILERELKRIMCSPASKFLSAGAFKRFLSLHAAYFPYYVAVLWAPNEFDAIRTAPEKRKAAFALCERLRKRSEPIYPALERYLKKVSALVSSRENVDAEPLMALLPRELNGYIKTGTLPTQSALKRRYPHSVVVSEHGESRLLTEKEGTKLIKRIDPDIRGVTELRGIGVSLGRARGRVRLVSRSDDLAKVRKGDILVATTTRPEWLSAMHRAGAFVTEIGSLLSHAAIVSRELRKPCVIGTKIATKVLKDGDMVEVDAEKGIVRVVKQ